MASTSQVTSGSDLPQEKVEHAFKLLGVSSRIPRVHFVVDRVVYRSFFVFAGSIRTEGWPVPR